MNNRRLPDFFEINDEDYLKKVGFVYHGFGMYEYRPSTSTEGQTYEWDTGSVWKVEEKDDGKKVLVRKDNII